MKITSIDIHRWLLEAVKLRTRVDIDSTVVHISEVTSCLRRAYYCRTRPLQLSPANALKLLGSEVHEALQEVLRRRGYEVEFQVAIVAGGVRLVGHADAYHPEKQHVLEFKTVSKIPQRPYDNHIKQLQAYVALTHSEIGYLVYISRNNGDIKVFEVKPSKYILRELIERARLLSTSLIRHEPPMPEQGPLCNYCEFRFLCFRGDSYDDSSYRKRRKK